MTVPPKLSIVIASLNGKQYVEACLASLKKQQSKVGSDAVNAEVIVADCVGKEVTDFIKREYPDVKLIEFNEPKSVPALRGAGILASTGEIVAMTEDHCLAAEDWYETMIASHEKHPQYPAIGGAVDNAATDRLIDWSVYFCEYSNFTSPLPEGVTNDLPGPNVSYKRAALDQLRDMLQDGYWETFLHQRLEGLGYQLYADPTIKVYHKKHFTFGSFLSERFHYGRWFGGVRNEFVSTPKRIFYLVLSPLLPPLILKRLITRVRSRGRHWNEFVRCLPYIGVFTLAWAAGEFTGYLTGSGQSVMKLS